ncbi:hypothetical protein NIES593_16485 [Hydrococcus rivularis NIES-593]|uniref:Uncharacterized protein n=1 Tax=Hydrococcus rivularis NIES-593 TaxID=1921803 RepID=A0A1U7HC82_9CYAN|nr:hypothetical protein [Hydrococcus rivularis]OKH21212.1 hypothetical protein NIES593_16485 [Hydrococcus rivularis NIES-593]
MKNGIALVVGSFSASADPLNEPKPLPQVDASPSSSLDTIEVGDRNRESCFPTNPQGTVTNYSESSNENEFEPLDKGFKLDFRLETILGVSANSMHRKYLFLTSRRRRLL